jgi:hypothetical protein
MGRIVRAARNAIGSIFLGLAVIGYVICLLAGTALHLYTILLTYSISGFFAATLSLVFPILVSAVLDLQDVVSLRQSD